jgi:hypothetical protein
LASGLDFYVPEDLTVSDMEAMFDKTGHVLEYEIGENGFVTEMTIGWGESACIPSGIKALLPHGYCMEFHNKSGIAMKRGLIAGAHLKYPRYPFFADALMNRNLVYNRTCDEVETLENEGTIFVLRPSRDVGVKRTESDRNKLQELYEVGTADTESNLPAILDYLNS